MTKYTKAIRITEEADKKLTEKANELQINKALLLDLLIRNALKEFSVKIVVEKNE